MSRTQYATIYKIKELNCFHTYLVTQKEILYIYIYSHILDLFGVFFIFFPPILFFRFFCLFVPYLEASTVSRTVFVFSILTVLVVFARSIINLLTCWQTI